MPIHAAPAAELTDKDNELLRRLLKLMDADASYSKIAGQGIGNVASLRDVVADDSLRENLAKALEGDGATLGDKRVAQMFRKTNGGQLESLLADVDRTVKKERIRPRVNKELEKYLGEKGFGPELMPVFESHGITSPAALYRVIADHNSSAYKNLHQSLGEDTEVAGKVYEGSPELANDLDELSVPEIEAVQDDVPPDFRETGLDTAAKTRYSQLKEAVQEVDALRRRDAGAAKELAKEVSQATQAKLKSILERANARELLSVFDKHAPVTVEDLNTALNDVSERLIAGSQSAFNALIYNEDQVPMSEKELAAANHIRRGVLITATGIYECSGSDLVKGACGCGTPGPFEEVVSDYESEQSYQFAEKTVKESSHTYATSSSILGGFFSSSGIGAASGAFQYAKSTMSSEAKAEARQSWKAVKVKERSIYAPKAVLTLPRERMELSRTALRYLKQIAVADPARRAEYARLFLANFGGHVFRSFTLGGRYSYVARAESANQTTYQELESALSEAQKKAGSIAGGFFGKFLLGGSSAHEDETTETSATSMTTTVGKQKQTVTVNISVRGGLQEMPLDQWKQSLLIDKWWRVIDRREAIAVWDLLRAASVPGWSTKERDDLAMLLERVWVRDVFLASLAESKMAGFEKFARMLKMQPRTVEGLEDMLRDHALRAVAPQMLLRCVTVTTAQESRGGEMVVTLPESWKILCGGGGTLENTSHVLIESYPMKVTAPDGKVSWRWHLKTMAAACADGRDTCSHGKPPRAPFARLTIGLILLFDPQDAWDVELFPRRVSAEEMKQEIPVECPSGYVLTGGGLRIDYYGRPAITGSGFRLAQAQDAAEGIPLQNYWVKTHNMETHHDGDENFRVKHSLTAYAIGVRAANGAPLQPVYTTELSSSKERHPNKELMHRPVANSSTMIGGGAWVTGERSFLSWSLPVFENSGRKMWKAYSADRANMGDEEQIQIVTIGLKNVETSIDTSPLPLEYSFRDLFEVWNEKQDGKVIREEPAEDPRRAGRPLRPRPGHPPNLPNGGSIAVPARRINPAGPDGGVEVR